MRKSKKIILEAVEKLIYGYENDTLVHRIDKCPLCLVYHKENDYTKSDCRGCLNSIFNNEFDDSYGCIQRGVIYKNLTFQHTNRKNTIMYWKKVYQVLLKAKPSHVLNLTPEIISEIEEVAKYCNNLKYD